MTTPPKPAIPTGAAPTTNADKTLARTGPQSQLDPLLELPPSTQAGPSSLRSPQDQASDILPTVLRKFEQGSGINPRGVWLMKILKVDGPQPLSPIGRLIKENYKNTVQIVECWRVMGKTALDVTVDEPSNLNDPGKEMNKIFEGVEIEIPSSYVQPEVGQYIKVYHPMAWDYRYPYGMLASEYGLEKGAGLITQRYPTRFSNLHFQPKSIQEYISKYSDPESLDFPNLTFSDTVNIVDSNPALAGYEKSFLHYLDRAAGETPGAKGMKINSAYRSPVNQASVVLRNYKKRIQGGVNPFVFADKYIKKLYRRALGANVDLMIELLKAKPEEVPNGASGKLGGMSELWAKNKFGHMLGNSLDISFQTGNLSAIIEAIVKAHKKFQSDHGYGVSLLIENNHFHLTIKKGQQNFMMNLAEETLKEFVGGSTSWDWLKVLKDKPPNMGGNTIAATHVISAMKTRAVIENPVLPAIKPGISGARGRTF